MTVRGAVVATILLLAAGVAGYAAWQRRDSTPWSSGADAGGASGIPSRPEVPEAQRAPPGIRVRVQVLNATRTPRLARRATFMLRDRGFDVVETGTAREQRDSTLVIDLSGNPAWAARVASAFGGARVESRPDTSRYLDVSVLIGASWRPPTEPFYP